MVHNMGISSKQFAAMTGINPLTGKREKTSTQRKAQRSKQARRFAKMTHPGTSDDFVILFMPLRLINTTNIREHWTARSRRAAQHRAWVHELMRGKAVPPFPWRVRITRIGKREMDSDSVPASAKSIRDGVADMAGVDDGDTRWIWEYDQSIAKEYAVRVEIYARK